MAKGNHIQIGVDPIRTLEQLELFVKSLREKAGEGDRYIDVRLTWGGKISGCVIDMDGHPVDGTPKIPLDPDIVRRVNKDYRNDIDPRDIEPGCR
jgi:hypothetical protein